MKLMSVCLISPEHIKTIEKATMNWAQAQELETSRNDSEADIFLTGFHKRKPIRILRIRPIAGFRAYLYPNVCLHEGISVILFHLDRTANYI
jgi:hypothetical protein